MDASAFEQVYGAFQDFHAYFAPLFGCREARDHSRHYLQALLVQSGERRNAGNLSGTVPASARVMQRETAASPWDDDTVIGRLQEYRGPRLGHPDAVWVLDGSDFPKQGRKSVGVARQYCGRLGKVANRQAGMFLAYVSPRGRVEGRTFDFTFDLPGKPKVGKPAKKRSEWTPPQKGQPKARQPKRRPELSTAEVEAKREERLEYERQRAKNPERKELHRLNAQQHRQKAREQGLCVAC